MFLVILRTDFLAERIGEKYRFDWSVIYFTCVTRLVCEIN